MSEASQLSFEQNKKRCPFYDNHECTGANGDYGKSCSYEECPFMFWAFIKRMEEINE